MNNVTDIRNWKVSDDQVELDEYSFDGTHPVSDDDRELLDRIKEAFNCSSFRQTNAKWSDISGRRLAPGEEGAEGSYLIFGSHKADPFHQYLGGNDGDHEFSLSINLVTKQIQMQHHIKVGRGSQSWHPAAEKAGYFKACHYAVMATTYYGYSVEHAAYEYP